MKKHKKLGRKLVLNKATIASLEQRKVVGGRTQELTTACYCPCSETYQTEVTCTLADCYTINTPTCGELSCECTDNCTDARLLCPCQVPLTY